jgi:TRAP transporter TAXI family solute receptor
MIAAVLAALSGASPALAKSYNLTVAGASPGGLWSLLGAGVDKALKAGFPGSTATYQTSGGGLANIGLLDKGSVELGIVHDQELALAIAGKPPFKSPVKSMRVISFLYTWAPMHVMVTKDFADKHGIETFEDLAAKKVPARYVVNKRGNISSPVAIEMLEAIGASPENIEKWGGSLVYAASKEQTGLIQDRRIDVVVNSLFVKHRSIMQAAQAVDLKLLPVSQAVIDKVNAATGSTNFTIPGGVYDFGPKDTPTLTLSAVLAVNASMSDEDAYNIAKALYENSGEIAGVHKAMSQLTTKVMASDSVAPFHPGALKYLKEAGLK